jgi:hypothetical protein
MQVGTYPTRNFAHVIPAVSNRRGPYLYPAAASFVLGEPAGDLIQWSSDFRVHLPGDLNDLQQTFTGQVPLGTHQLNDTAELAELGVFPAAQRMRQEKLADLLQDGEFANPQAIAVIVIRPHDSTAEETLQRKEQLAITLVLHDNKFGQHLITDRQLWVPVDLDVEAAFRVRETDDPILREFHAQLQTGYSAYGLWGSRGAEGGAVSCGLPNPNHYYAGRCRPET